MVSSLYEPKYLEQKLLNIVVYPIRLQFKLQNGAFGIYETVIQLVTNNCDINIIMIGYVVD